MAVRGQWTKVEWDAGNGGEGGAGLRWSSGGWRLLCANDEPEAGPSVRRCFCLGRGLRSPRLFIRSKQQHNYKVAAEHIIGATRIHLIVFNTSP